MITNLLATIVVSIVTNWTPVYEQVPWYPGYSVIPCQAYATSTPAICSNLLPINPAVYTVPEQPKGKYLGEDGLVIERAEISFDYNGQRVTTRLDKPLEKIIRRCHDKPVEQVWDDEVREKL